MCVISSLFYNQIYLLVPSTKVQDYMFALDKRNVELVNIINTSLLVCVLDEHAPRSQTEVGASCC